jgi:2-methylcitrate dehydratase PrpD
LLAAAVLGMEVACATAEILMPSHYKRGFHVSATAGAVGAAAGSSMLLELDEERTGHALAIAIHCAAGLLGSIGSMSKSYGIGSAARNGVAAAYLARGGLTGTKGVFESANGMLSAMSVESKRKARQQLDELGQRWRALEITYKTFPTGVAMHAPIECALSLRRRPDADGAKNVDAFDFSVDPLLSRYWGGHSIGKTLDSAEPASALEAKFNFRFCTSAAWLLGRFTHKDIEVNLRNPSVLELMKKISLGGRAGMTMDGAALRARFTDGSEELVEVPAHRGSPGNPLADHDLDAKLLTASTGVLARRQARALLRTVWTLDQVADSRALTDLLVLS